MTSPRSVSQEGLTPAQVTEQGGVFQYFLKRYLLSDVETDQISGYPISRTIAMEAGAAYLMPDGREIIIHWHHDYVTGKFTEGHVAEYPTPMASVAEGWWID